MLPIALVIAAVIALAAYVAVKPSLWLREPGHAGTVDDGHARPFEADALARIGWAQE